MVTSTTGTIVTTTQFDPDGNSLLSQRMTQNGSIAASTTTYGYTQAITPNAALTVTTPGQPATYYGYDQHGDTTSITNGSSLNTAIQYDSAARPITITLADGTQAALGYNADGLRASYSVTKGGTTSLAERFQYRGGELAQALVVSGTQSYTDTYVYAPSGAPLELLRTTPSGSTSRYWYQVDGRGNVVALTDATGNVLDRYSYDLWGDPTSVSESVPQQLRYGGYWWDAALGWYWVSVRYYDPVLERWLQPDPSAQDGVHTYAYVYDDPIDYTDPSGLDSKPAPVPAPTPYSPPPQATPTPTPGLSSDSPQESSDPCNVFIFGYWCNRNLHQRQMEARAIQARTHCPPHCKMEIGKFFTPDFPLIPSSIGRAESNPSMGRYD